MSGITFHTLRDILCPSDNQDTRIILSQAIEGQSTASAIKTSPFSLKRTHWEAKRLPPSAHLSIDLPSRMQEHLNVIIDQHYPDQAARATFPNLGGRGIITPDSIMEDLRDRCTSHFLHLSYEPGTTPVVESLSYYVKLIYGVLTGNPLDVQSQQRTGNNSVITDYTFRLGDRVQILWENKSSKAFDKYIGELMDQMRDRPADICTETRPTMYGGYKAILGKLGYHASDIQPRTRWAIVFSGLRYFIIYIPCTPEKPEMYCSPVMRFCLRSDDEQEALIRPPLWSILVYMLLVETRGVEDEELRQIFGLLVAVPVEDPSSSSSRSKFTRIKEGLKLKRPRT